MFHDFPYTDFHELNLDFLMRQCGAGLGLRLAIEGDYLRLVNAKNEVVSQIKVHYSDTALSDTNGKPIKTYICDAHASGTALIFVNGQNEVTTITVPYAEKAKYDINSHEIEDYVYNVQVAGDNLRVTKGDQTIADITVPYAVQATEDEDGKTISTYAAELNVDGNNLVLRDAKGRVLESITVPYATEAYHAGSADMAAEAAHAEEADSALDADHADLADLATVATDCTNAIQSVSISGNNVLFTTYAGQVTTLTIPYATKAQKDDAGNTIKTTYVASVSQDPVTGEISFLDATGNAITSLVPTASKATYDSYDNEIADYIKNMVVSSNSDYVTVTHGTGAVDTIQINYSTHAFKDTNENVIKNTYCRLLTMETDTITGDPVLVGWNGDNPTAEIFRLRVHAISSYIIIDGSNPDSSDPDTYTPTSIVGDPLNSKEHCVLIDASTGMSWDRTSSNNTEATFTMDSTQHNIATNERSIGRHDYEYNVNTGKVVRNAIWDLSINNNTITPDAIKDLTSITVNHMGTKIKYETRSGAGSVIFNTDNVAPPWYWEGPISITAKDEEGNTLTSAEVIAKIEAGAAIQVIATVTNPGGEGNYTPSKIHVRYDNRQTPATINAIDCYFMEHNNNYVDFYEGRRLSIMLYDTNVTGVVYIEAGKMLDNLSDVQYYTMLSDGDVLTYNSGTQTWINRSAATGGEGLVVTIFDGLTSSIYNMLVNDPKSITFDTDADSIRTALLEGRNVILYDGSDSAITFIGAPPYQTPFALMGPSNIGVTTFILQVTGDDSGTLTRMT